MVHSLQIVNIHIRARQIKPLFRFKSVPGLPIHLSLSTQGTAQQPNNLPQAIGHDLAPPCTQRPQGPARHRAQPPETSLN